MQKAVSRRSLQLSGQLLEFIRRQCRGKVGVRFRNYIPR
jgi:hypothetical protein